MYAGSIAILQYVRLPRDLQKGGALHLCAELVLAAPQWPSQPLQHAVAEHLHQVAGLHGEAERHRAARERLSDTCSSSAVNRNHRCGRSDVWEIQRRDLPLCAALTLEHW